MDYHVRRHGAFAAVFLRDAIGALPENGRDHESSGCGAPNSGGRYECGCDVAQSVCV